MADEAGVIDGIKLDRISSLTDDLLLCILTRLPIDAAVRTSTLSPRWGNLWKKLRDLVFCDFFCGNGSQFLNLVNGTLTGRGDTSIDRLIIWITSPVNLNIYHVADWLSLARPLVKGELELSLPPLGEEHGHTVIYLPCFHSTTAITLTAMGAELRLPGSLPFCNLERLVLGGVRFTEASPSPGHMVSSCCPKLQVLEMSSIWGLPDILINSSSLTELRLTLIHELAALDVTAAKLETLLIYECPFIADNPKSISVKTGSLKVIHWKGPCPKYITLGDKKFLDRLSVTSGLALLDKDSSLRLILRCFAFVTRLVLNFAIPRQSSDLEIFLEAMKSVQVLKVLELELSVTTNGHDFRRPVDLIIWKSTSLRKLKVTFIQWMDDRPCHPACSCRKPMTWIGKDKLILLEEIIIVDYTDTEDEREFVNLISSGPSLKKLSIVCKSKYQLAEVSTWAQGLCGNVKIS